MKMKSINKVIFISQKENNRNIFLLFQKKAIDASVLFSLMQKLLDLEILFSFRGLWNILKNKQFLYYKRPSDSSIIDFYQWIKMFVNKFLPKKSPPSA